MNGGDAVKLAALIHNYWRRWEPPDDETEVDAMVAAWARLCADVPLDAMIAACDTLAAEGREHAPPIGVIRARAVELVAHALAEHVPDVDQAWAEVRRRASEIGFHAAIGLEWSHPAVREAVDAIGWRRLCLDDNESTLFAQFRDIYGKAAARAHRTAAVPGPAVGLVAEAARRLAERRRELEATK